MNKFENYNRIKRYLDYENNMDLIFLSDVGKSDANTQILTIFKGSFQIRLNLFH